jgi:hypothetical protein
MIISAGTNLIISFINGIADSYGDIITAGVDAVVRFLEGLGKNFQKVIDAGGQLIVDLMNGIAAAIEDHLPDIRKAAIRIGLAVLDGLTFGFGSTVADWLGLIDKTAKDSIEAMENELEVESPSKAFMRIGEYLIAGLALGISNDSAVVSATSNVAGNLIKTLNNSLTGVAANLESMDDFNPTITPVLDLSNVQNGSRFIGSMLGSSTIGANVSFGKASAISGMQNQNTKNTAVKVSPQVNEIKFEQTINSPVALSTSEIYRNTKTQISMAKEELRLV